MATLRMFEQIKTEPLQFFPQNFANSKQTGSVILQTNSATVSSDVRFINVPRIIQ